jgi:hypothetical protein
MVPALAKLLEKTVKSSYSMLCFSLFFLSLIFNHLCLMNSCFFKNSPQAIFRDPFRRGNNILVSPSIFISLSFFNTFD